MPKLKEKINLIYSTSVRTTNLLNSLGFKVEIGKPDKILQLYVDGADEVDKDLNLIKGGGGAHTNEKIIASSSSKFICIVDKSKLVSTLGAFPLPLELITECKEQVIEHCKKYTQSITVRKDLSDNGNTLIDLHGMKITDPLKIENEINKIDGVIEVGIFAKNKPRIVIVGNDEGYESIES